MIFLYAYLLILSLWVFYLAAMKLKVHRHELKPVAKFFGYQVLIIGLIIDVFANFTLMTILTLDPPRELTVTARLQRYKHKTGWKGKIRKWFCGNLLDIFDEGEHC